MLLVWCQVQHDVSGREQLFVGAYGEAVFGGVLPRLALLGDGSVAQRVGHIEAAVAQVQTLIQTLSAATDDDDLLALKRIDAFGELVKVHEAALAELSELFAQRQGVEVIGHVVLSIRGVSRWILPIGERFVN